MGEPRSERDHSPELSELLERLYREQYGSLLTHARQLLGRAGAEDVVQRAFEKVWRRRPEPGQLANPVGYVITATRNEIHRELRRALVERDRTAGTDGLEAYPVMRDGMSQVDDRMALGQALAGLPAREREAVVLRVQWQLTIEEAASVMGVSVGAVKGYTHHGLRKLRDLVAAC